MVRPPLPRYPLQSRCRHSGPHHSTGGHHYGVIPLPSGRRYSPDAYAAIPRRRVARRAGLRQPAADCTIHASGVGARDNADEQLGTAWHIPYKYTVLYGGAQLWTTDAARTGACDALSGREYLAAPNPTMRGNAADSRHAGGLSVGAPGLTQPAPPRPAQVCGGSMSGRWPAGCSAQLAFKFRPAPSLGELPGEVGREFGCRANESGGMRQDACQCDSASARMANVCEAVGFSHGPIVRAFTPVMLWTSGGDAPRPAYLKCLS